ncbi:hypothetical protein SAMN05444166_0294 [Singulisphaera sp. GP187]|nr:hypothetical protein SAMN05444166_0294 [Singulisphaera sp. GP187]
MVNTFLGGQAVNRSRRGSAEDRRLDRQPPAFRPSNGGPPWFETVARIPESRSHALRGNAVPDALRRLPRRGRGHAKAAGCHGLHSTREHKPMFLAHGLSTTRGTLGKHAIQRKTRVSWENASLGLPLHPPSSIGNTPTCHA